MNSRTENKPVNTGAQETQTQRELQQQYLHSHRAGYTMKARIIERSIMLIQVMVRVHLKGLLSRSNPIDAFHSTSVLSGFSPHNCENSAFQPIANNTWRIMPKVELK